jgi:hypothetical protein
MKSYIIAVNDNGELKMVTQEEVERFNPGFSTDIEHILELVLDNKAVQTETSSGPSFRSASE